MRGPRLGFQRNPVAYRSLTGPWEPPVGLTHREGVRLENFPFSGKFYLVSRAHKARFLFRMVPAFGRTAPRAPGRPAFKQKRAHMGCFWALRALNPPKITKILQKCYILTQKFNKNLIFDMCFLVKIQPFLTKMMENYGKFTKFTLDKAFIL